MRGKTLYLLILLMTLLPFMTKSEELRASLSVRDGEILDLSCRVPDDVSITKVDKLELLFESLTTSGASGSLALVTSDNKLHSSKLRPQASVKGSITNDLKNTFLQVSMPFSQSDYGKYKCTTFYEENLHTTTASTEMIVDIKSERSQKSSNFNVKVVPAFELNFTWTLANGSEVTEYTIKRATDGERKTERQTTVYAKYENPSTVYKSNTALLRNFTSTLKPVYDSFEANNILLLVVEKEKEKSVSRFIADVSDSYNSATVVAFVSQPSRPATTVHRHEIDLSTKLPPPDTAARERILCENLIIVLVVTLIGHTVLATGCLISRCTSCSKLCKNVKHRILCGVVSHRPNPNTAEHLSVTQVTKGMENECCHNKSCTHEVEHGENLLCPENTIQDGVQNLLKVSEFNILRISANVEIRDESSTEVHDDVIDLHNAQSCAEGMIAYGHAQSENESRAESENTGEVRIARENSQPATQEEFNVSDHEVDRSKTPCSFR